MTAKPTDEGFETTPNFDTRTGEHEKLTAVEKALDFALKHLHTGELSVTFPSGITRDYAGKTATDPAIERARLHIQDIGAVRRILKSGSMGLAEGYMANEWSTDHLTDLLKILSLNQKWLESKLPITKSLRVIERFTKYWRRNSKAGSRKNIAYHYDLGNEFYQLWLDESMTYSSAYFPEKETSLHEAQLAKYANIARLMDIKEGQHILEIGCGWGGFAEYATTQLGCKITCLTLSVEQLNFAKERLAKLDMSERAEFLLRDYRDMTGQFDHIVSIEMIEAVGEEYWDTYFSQLNQLLKPEGRVGIQVITIHEDHFENYRRGMDFIQKYIFPGGMLPTDRLVKEYFSRNHLRCYQQFDLAQDYAHMLKLWHDRFLEKLDEVKQMGFDQRFIQMWRFYLSYCEAGFSLGSIDVAQYVARKS